MSAPKGQDVPIPEDEAIARTLDIPVDPDDNNSPTLGESDRTLEGLLYTGGETEYAHIYLASTTGTYNGNEMMWMRYVWLSKPGAFESDMFGSNGISIRMVEGMSQELPALVAAAANGLNNGGREDPLYLEA